MDSQNYPGGDGSVQRLTKDIVDLLSPIEPLVMRIQSLLVWEYPKRSAVMVICVHLLFWFLAATRMSSYFLISSATLIIFFLDTWKKKIWPEIRVPPPVPDDIDGWTPVHPRLLNVHEISQHAAQVLYNLIDTLRECRLYRRNNPKIFSSACSTCFIVLIAIGHYVPGIMLSYIMVISVMAWPCVVYHNLLQKLYLKMEPVFMWLDYNLKIKMPRSNTGTGRSLLSGVSSHNASATVEDDFEEFCPPSDPTTTALLARAITDSEDEGGSSAIHTPQLSKTPSVENSDNEEEEAGFNLGLERMPSFDDLDQTDDEFLPNDENTTNPIAFIPSHFGDNSDTENEDMNFPDISEVDHSASQVNTANAYSALASSLVSQTLSSMVENALQGVVGRGDHSTSSHGRLPGTDAQLTYTRTDEGEAVDLLQEDTTIEEEDEEEEDDMVEEIEEDEETSMEAEIEKEFDFLDDFDPGSKSKK